MTIQELKYRFDVQYNRNGIQSVSLHPSNKGVQWTFSTVERNQNIEESVNQWFEEYCMRQEPSIKLPFDWTNLSSFTQEALQAVNSIPFGSLLSYGQVGDLLGRPEAARAVGGACRRNPFILLVPCHRVLDAKFRLRGYSVGGFSIKSDLLRFEGLKF